MRKINLELDFERFKKRWNGMAQGISWSYGLKKVQDGSGTGIPSGPAYNWEMIRVLNPESLSTQNCQPQD